MSQLTFIHDKEQQQIFTLEQHQLMVINNKEQQ